MAQPTNHRELDHAPPLRRLHRTRLGRVLAERQGRAAGVIAFRNVPAQESKMSFDHHSMVSLTGKEATTGARRHSAHR